MTPDDEAFVRAIVDRPGDDLPRLVYADWLDERGDPRGAYLRAEAAAPGSAAALAPLAKGLDPVWVARVSRPPVGVCCDHIVWCGSGSSIAAHDIDAAERRLNGRFPADLRAFALNYNGGEPSPACLPDPRYADDPLYLQIGRFFEVRSASSAESVERPPSWNADIEGQLQWHHELFEMGGGDGLNPLLAGLLPLTETLHDLGTILIRITDVGNGRILHFTDYCHQSSEPQCLIELAPSLAELLSRVGPDIAD